METLKYDCEKMQQYILEMQNADHSHVVEFFNMCNDFVVMLANKKNFNYAPAFDLDDLAQEVSLKILENLQTYDASKSKIQTWLSSIVKNTYCSLYRKEYAFFQEDEEENEKKFSTVSLYYSDENGEDHSYADEYLRALDDVEFEILVREESAFFDWAIDQLPKKQREAMLLFCRHFSPEEAAAIMGCSVPNYYNHLSRARRALRCAYEQEYERSEEKAPEKAYDEEFERDL